MGDFLSLRLSSPHWFPVSLVCYYKPGYPNQWMTGLDDQNCFLYRNVALHHHLCSLPSLMSNRCWRFFSWVKNLEREANHTPSSMPRLKRRETVAFFLAYERITRLASAEQTHLLHSRIFVSTHDAEPVCKNGISQFMLIRAASNGLRSLALRSQNKWPNTSVKIL
jgi:hypothetical protein